MSARIGVDVGGTFTDVVLETGATFHSTKLLTTHEAPEQAILTGISHLCEQYGVPMAEITQIIHGTTLATNALIERRGAETAFVTTAGFRDVIETRTESRFDQYDLDIVLPTPLIKRADRFVVDERINAEGAVLVPFDDASAHDVIERIIAGGYESVAVGFLHSYRCADHERRFRDLLLAAAPHVSVSISAEVSPQMREFERFNTVCANAYVQPLMSSYLRRFVEQLKRHGGTCPVYLIHSGGGLIDSVTASRFPIRLVESGPAGGAIFAADLARRLGRDNVLSFDMGGTTAKIALIERGVARTANTFEVARTTRFAKGSGMPISIPVIEMIEIGAGGGSIARVDQLGQIRVGPHSTGSEPGPAAYGRGGTDATITDANVQLGRIPIDGFGSSSLRLCPELAHAALQRSVGDVLGLDANQSAAGVVEIVDEDMCSAARVHAVENGKDLTEFSMIAFGGAAPVHAARLIDKLGVRELFIPVDAGVGSAVGFLLAPFSYQAVRSLFTTTDDFDVAEAASVLDALVAEATEFVRVGAGDDDELLVERTVMMRYRGQGWEIPVSVPDGPFDRSAVDALITEFERTYVEYFGRLIDGHVIETVSWSVRVETASADAPAIEAAPDPVAVRAQPERTQPVIACDTGSVDDAVVIPRHTLRASHVIEGPALIVESQTTTVLAKDHRAVVLSDGTLKITSVRSATTTGIHADATSDRAEATLATHPGRFAHQVMWNRLISVVEEQARTLIRTSFSTSVREAGDLSAGVFDTRGRMIAQAVTGTPGHVNTMAVAVGHFIADIGRDNIADGDVYVTNDPWKGTGHLHDFTVCTPVFDHGKLVGFFASTSHVVDVGGRGYGPDSGELYEEGLRVPIMKWADRGRLNTDLLSIITNNVRSCDLVVGDIHGLVACNDTGRRRLLAMMAEFGLDTLDELANAVFERTTAAVAEAIAQVPPGTYHHTMDVDGYDEPVHLAVTLTVTADTIHADFSGTSPTSRFGINVPLTYAEAYFTYAMMVALAPGVPNNHASLAPFSVSAPDGVILHAAEPDPVSVRHVIGHFVTDLCLGALAHALPDRIPAEGAGTLWNFQASARSADPTRRRLTPVEVLMFNSGGSGARPTADGLTATAFPSGVRTMSAEATEQVGPIILWRKEIREHSGGAGMFRGGDGQIIEVGATDGYQLLFSAMFDRVDHPARGRNGGHDGAPGRVYLDDGSAFRSKGKQWIPVERRLVMELPGGGGWGPPA